MGDLILARLNEPAILNSYPDISGNAYSWNGFLLNVFSILKYYENFQKMLFWSLISLPSPLAHVNAMCLFHIEILNQIMIGATVLAVFGKSSKQSG